MFFAQSCQKEINESIPPAPAKPDTLAVGWSSVTVADAGKLSDIYFKTAAIGYLAGADKVYKSVDSGHTWVSVFNNPGIFNIYMQSDTRGFFVEFQLWQTKDGGNIFFAPGVFNGGDVCFSGKYGYCTTLSGLYQSLDSGENWHRVFTNGLSLQGGYSSVYNVSYAPIWIVAATGVYTTTVNETHFKKCTTTGGTGPPFCSISVPPVGDSMYVGNFQGQLYRSSDIGNTFSIIKNFPATGFMDLHFLTAKKGYLSVGPYIYKTIDGVNWQRVVALGNGVVHEIHFIDEDHGWACADNGQVLLFRQ